MTLTITGIGRAALDLFYPPRCVLCGAGGPFICTKCRDGLPRADGLRCDACWLPKVDYCFTCAERPLAFDRLRSVCRYEGQARSLVHKLKFGYQSCLAEPLAAEMQPLLAAADPDADLLVPVPMPGRRERERGFNQSHLLAKHIATRAGLPVVQALSRSRDSGTQVSSSTAEERWRRVRGAFAIKQLDAIANRRIVLIDDVATTGATLDACARVLLDAGASSVSALTFARED